MRWYALSNRPWIEEADGSGHWGLPPGAIGSVDLAPVGSQNHAFVTSDKPFDPADVAAAIGDGTRLDKYVPTAAEATAWEKLVGVAVQPGWTLLDALWATLTSEADPDGVTRAKPIMPTHKGVLELHLGGHSLVRAEKLPKDPTTHPAWPKIQRVLQNDYRAIRGSGRAEERTLARKWLGAQQAKYRLSPEAARDLIIPADLPRELPLRPTTTITDDFNRADADALGTSAEGWSWTEVLFDFDIVSNRARLMSDTFAGGHASARAESALSSDDHYAEIDIPVGNTGSARRTGPVVRFAAAANSFYGFGNLDNGYELLRVLANSRTVLGSSATVAAFPKRLRIAVDGSNLEGFIDGISDITVTDTNFTGQLHTGFWATAAAVDAIQFDNFEAADLLAETELVRVLSEPLGSGEAQSRARGRTSANDEGLVIDQVVQRLREVARHRDDTVALAEMSMLARALSRLRNETAGLIETTSFVVEALAEALVRVLAETVAMAEAVTRPRRLSRVRAELAGIADAVARVGGFVSAAVPIITNLMRMRVEPSTRMNVPPARR